jgi:uncharacterized protein
MELNLDSFRKDHFLIKSCNADGIQVNEQQFSQSIVVCLDQAPRSWSPDSIDKISANEISALLHVGNPELILIGTGVKHCFPPAVVLIPLLEAKIGYEIMDTAAACRTYNVLAAEGRRVVAGLILPK